MKVIVVILILLNCASVSAISFCPYDVPPTRPVPNNLFIIQGCSCNNVMLNCFNLLEIPELKLEYYTIPVTSATFDTGYISRIPSKRLPPALTSLTFTDNQVKDVDNDAFQDVSATLTDLVFSGANFTRIPDAFGGLSSLTTLKIENTQILDWNTAVLETLGNRLTSLTLNSVGLVTWPTWLRSFTTLKSLAISYNDLKQLPDDAFTASAATLEDVTLINVNLTQLPSALMSLGSLTRLDLSRNRLTARGLEQMANFPFAKNLLTLKLTFMELTDIPNFANLTHLDELDLSYNKFTTIPAGTFPTHIGQIQMNNNQITQITPANFRNYANLVILYLSFNPITAIDPSSFTSLVGLKYLHLEYTNLREIPQAVTALTSLKSLLLPQDGIQCTCPHNAVLVHWFASYLGTIVGKCQDGRWLREYLSGTCEVSTKATTTTTAMTTANTGGNDHVPTLGSHVFCRYISWIILLVLYFGRN